jgi:hypothetical protein
MQAEDFWISSNLVLIAGTQSGPLLHGLAIALPGTAFRCVLPV